MKEIGETEGEGDKKYMKKFVGGSLFFPSLFIAKTKKEVIRKNGIEKKSSDIDGTRS